MRSRSAIVRFLFSLDDFFDVSSVRRTTFRFVRTFVRANTWRCSYRCPRRATNPAPPNGRLPRDLKAAKILLTAARSASQEIERSIAGNRFHGRPTSFGPSDVYGSLCSRTILGSFLGDGCLLSLFLVTSAKRNPLPGGRQITSPKADVQERREFCEQMLEGCSSRYFDVIRCSFFLGYSVSIQLYDVHFWMSNLWYVNQLFY